MSVKQSLLALGASLALCFLTAFIGSQHLPGEWYRALAKPRWTPPNWIFGPVWTLLYTLMALAAWLVWQKAGFRGAAFALIVFVAQLGLNAAWSYFFFGLRRPGLALADILALWVAILVTMISFWSLRPLAGILFLPYLLWVSFAAVLNHAIWRLNR
jgi:tryptophan-rich sensory protein